jgi:hypothetical protein
VREQPNSRGSEPFAVSFKGPVSSDLLDNQAGRNTLKHSENVLVHF